MAFSFNPIFAILACCSQASFAVVVAPSSATILPAASIASTFSSIYTSSYIPKNTWYTHDLLSYAPYYMFCDCDLSPYMDPVIAAEVRAIATAYNQRLCDVQQWDRIINNNMPGIPNVNEINMLVDIAQSVQREQLRRDLIFYPHYPEMCLEFTEAVTAGAVPVSTAPVVPQPGLYKRDPMTTVNYGSTNVAANMAAANAAVNAVTTDFLTNSPYYYSMLYLFDRALPHISAQLQLDIQNAVYWNTPNQYLANAYQLIHQLRSNIRGMVSEMTDLTPTPIETILY